MSGFKIELAGLAQGMTPSHIEAEPRELGLVPEEEWAGKVAADVTLERSGDNISVRGTLQGSAMLECVRCLRTFELPLRVPFEVFAERAGTGPRREEEELERDDYMTFHDGRELDLSQEAHDTIVLELPIAPHCRDDCRGLCPRCGADLNEGPCGCEVATEATRPARHHGG
jgi:uncharacterized protein